MGGASILNSTAQLNGGFENWHDEFLYQVPDNWQTLNFLSILSPPNPLSAFKATGIDKHSGNYALKIKTFFVNNNPAPNIIDDSVGLIFTGKVNYSPTTIKLGFPYSSRPEKLDFWAKYSPVGNDTGGAIVLLQKWNGISADTVAFGQIYIAATGAYTPMQINLTYYSNVLPDTAAIIFGASLKMGRTRVGSTMYIDDVALIGWVGIDEKNQLNNKVKIFPNPANENLTITTEFEEAENIRIMDVSGKTVGRSKIQDHNSNVNTGLFVEGMYFYEICDKNNKILAKGKFSIVK